MIVRALIITVFLLALFAVFQPAYVQAACVPGTASHFVRGNGAVQAGIFQLSAKENPATESGTVTFTQTGTPSATIQGNLACVDFLGTRVDFSGTASLWNGIFWDPGYTITGYAIDGGFTPPLDQFSLAWCKNSSCTTFLYPTLTSGYVTIK